MRKRRFLIGIEINRIEGGWYDLDGEEVLVDTATQQPDGPGELILEIECIDDTGGRAVNCWDREYVAGSPERHLVAAWIERPGHPSLHLDDRLPELERQYRRRIEEHEPPDIDRDYE